MPKHSWDSERAKGAFGGLLLLFFFGGSAQVRRALCSGVVLPLHYVRHVRWSIERDDQMRQTFELDMGVCTG